jgi:hypothetical protein
MELIKWVPCNHGMMCPKFADRGQGLQIWKVSVNILNKQLQTANKGWSSIKNQHVTRCYTGPQTWFFWNDLSNGTWTRDLEIGMSRVSIGPVQRKQYQEN